ncbi:MAG: ROK family transcriptional regulator [Pseudomonadota bacterium]
MDGLETKSAVFENGFEVAGSNQVDMRVRNERLVLTILRRQGPLPKAEIARKTGLSAQTVSVIMRALERDGLLTKGEKLRGKVGQPSVPMRLAPTGAYSLGLKVGRRSAELVLINFVGEELFHITKTYDYPLPDTTLDFVRTAVSEICQKIPKEERHRIAGLGIASPFFLWEWANVIGVDPDKMAAWREFDLRGEIAALFEFPVYLMNDATSACSAELAFGSKTSPPDFLYIYIGYFVGGGVVLNGTVYAGRSGNAGAIGTFPILSQDREPVQLVNKASLIGLEKRFAALMIDTPTSAWSRDDVISKHPEIVDAWLGEAAPSLIQLIIGACSIIDFPTVLIDGNMAASLRDLVVRKVAKTLIDTPLPGLVKPEVIGGTLGSRARPLGAASLPLAKKFMLEA